MSLYFIIWVLSWHGDYNKFIGGHEIARMTSCLLYYWLIFTEQEVCGFFFFPFFHASCEFRLNCLIDECTKQVNYVLSCASLIPMLEHFPFTTALLYWSSDFGENRLPHSFGVFKKCYCSMIWHMFEIGIIPLMLQSVLDIFLLQNYGLLTYTRTLTKFTSLPW